MVPLGDSCEWDIRAWLEGRVRAMVPETAEFAQKSSPAGLPARELCRWRAHQTGESLQAHKER
jgi:hypothetical protein